MLTTSLLLPSLLTTLTTALPSLSGSPILFGPGGTYPRAIRLSDRSTLLGTYADKRGANSTLTSVRSLDNGATWNAIGTIDTAPKALRDLDNPYIYETPQGRILAAFRNHDRSAPGANTFSFYRITLCSSEDGGASWSYLSTPASDPGGVNGNWEPFLQRGLDGSTQLFYSRESAATDQESLLRRSTDGGRSWTSAQIISGDRVESRDGMVGVARTPDEASRKMVAVFETGNPGLGVPFRVLSVSSGDDGASWSTKRSVVYEVAGKNAGAPQIVRVGGALVASFGTDEDGGVWPAGAIKIVVSRDGGVSWGEKTTVVKPDAFWAGMVALDERSLLVFYQKSGSSYAQKVVL